jgi:hypothetical protein
LCRGLSDHAWVRDRAPPGALKRKDSQMSVEGVQSVKAKCLSRLRSTWDDTLANSTFTVVRNVQLASHQDDYINY